MTLTELLAVRSKTWQKLLNFVVSNPCGNGSRKGIYSKLPILDFLGTILRPQEKTDQKIEDNFLVVHSES